MVPEEVARRYLVLPVNQRDGHLTVAMTDPTDLQLLQDLAARTGRIIDPVVTTRDDIQEHIDLYCWQPAKLGHIGIREIRGLESLR